MFPLVKLPNELILHVINDVHPEDLEPLALCGKAIRALAKDALSRHMMLKRKYNEIIIADKARSEPSEKDNGFGYHDQHSFVLIEEISEDKSRYSGSQILIIMHSLEIAYSSTLLKSGGADSNVGQVSLVILGTYRLVITALAAVMLRITPKNNWNRTEL